MKNIIYKIPKKSFENIFLTFILNIREGKRDNIFSDDFLIFG